MQQHPQALNRHTLNPLSVMGFHDLENRQEGRAKGEKGALNPIHLGPADSSWGLGFGAGGWGLGLRFGVGGWGLRVGGRGFGVGDWGLGFQAKAPRQPTKSSKKSCRSCVHSRPPRRQV